MRKVRTPEPEGFAEFWEGTLPSQEYLRQCFEYDAESGTLKWKERPRSHFSSTQYGRRSQVLWNQRYAGKVVGSLTQHGHLRTSVGKRCIYVHRIIWKIVHGTEPEVVDHVNGDGADNRLNNLRACTQAVNARNASRGKITGVYKHSKADGYYAQVSIKGRVKSKLFRTREEAIAWRVAVARDNGFSDRHLGVSR